jgi:hypothetical protein
MTMTKAQTNKLLTQLTGKEAFIVMMQAFVERSLNQPVTFTDPEIKRMMDAVWSNPHRAHEFKQYKEAQDVMNVAMYEGRLAIQEAITHILLQIMLTSQIAHDRKPHAEVIEWADDHTDTLQRNHAQLIHWLEWMQIWQLVLQAFDTAYSINMGEMIAIDLKKLEMFITVYHDRMGWVEYDIIYARIKAAEEAKASQSVIDGLSEQYVPVMRHGGYPSQRKPLPTIPPCNAASPTCTNAQSNAFTKCWTWRGFKISS